MPIFLKTPQSVLLKYPSSGTLDTINRAKKVDKYYGNIV